MTAVPRCTQSRTFLTIIVLSRPVLFCLCIGGDQKYRADQLLQLLYFLIFPKNSFARTFFVMPTNLGKKKSKLPQPYGSLLTTHNWICQPLGTHTVAFGSENEYYKIEFALLPLSPHVVPSVDLNPLSRPCIHPRCRTACRSCTATRRHPRLPGAVAPPGPRCCRRRCFWNPFKRHKFVHS